MILIVILIESRFTDGEQDAEEEEPIRDAGYTEPGGSECDQVARFSVVWLCYYYSRRHKSRAVHLARGEHGRISCNNARSAHDLIFWSSERYYYLIINFANLCLTFTNLCAVDRNWFDPLVKGSIDRSIDRSLVVKYLWRIYADKLTFMYFYVLYMCIVLESDFIAFAFGRTFANAHIP